MNLRPSLRRLAVSALVGTVSTLGLAQTEPDLTGLRELPFRVTTDATPSQAFPQVAGRTLQRVIVRFAGESAESAELAKVLGVSVGDPFDPIVLEAGLAALRARPEVGEIKVRLFESSGDGRLVLWVELARAAAAAPQPPSRMGVLLGMPKAFPLLYQDRRSMLLIGGMFSASGFGGFNTWFGQGEALNNGNPLAADPSGSQAFWGEGYGSVSLTGITTLTPNLYGYFQTSILGGGTVGQDAYDSASRGKLALELANVGLAYAVKSGSGRRQAVNVRVGRQNYVLGEGLQIVGGAGNGGGRGNLFLIPRQAFEQSALVQFRLDDLKLEGFMLNPNETPEVDSATRIEGANLEYRNSQGFQGALTYLRVPESNSTYLNPAFQPLPREGMRAWNFRGKAPLGANFDLAAEYVAQSHDKFKMAADALVGTLTYRPRGARSNVSFSYRYAQLSGDDPNTATYERFDPLLGGGTIDTWANSFSFAFALPNSNLRIHRLRADYFPNQRTKLTAQYTHLSAMERFNAGGPAPLSVLSSRDYGQEVGMALQHFLNQNTILIGAASVSVPGSAFRAIDARKTWTYLQFGVLFAF